MNAGIILSLRMTLPIATALVFFAGSAGASASRVSSTDPTSVAKTLYGYYVLEDVEGSGSWTGMQSRYPKAELVDGLAKPGAGFGPPRDAQGEGKSPHGAGQAYIVGNGTCGTSSVPGMYSRSAAISIVPGKDAVLMAAETPGARHIFLSGAPDFKKEPSSNMGYSVGHYEEDSLVVDTVKLSGGMVPGGGRIGPDTHLEERYKLINDGKRLEITFTWSDPKIYKKPHTYSMNYVKQPATSYALEEWCDSSDPKQKESITPPEQR